MRPIRDRRCREAPVVLRAALRSVARQTSAIALTLQRSL